MTIARQAINRIVASLIPPIGALVAERDRLRAENARLVNEADRMAVEIDRLTTENNDLTAGSSTQEIQSSIRDEFYARGFAVIRNAIDRRRVEWFFAECVQPATAFWSARAITDADVTTMNGYYGGPWPAESYKYCQHWRYVMDRMLRFATGGTHNFFELLSEPIWSAISSLSAGPFIPSVWATSRSVDHDKGKSTHDDTVTTSTAESLHYDRLYHDDGDFVINVWCPLQDVGETFGRPSVSLIPAPLHEIVPLFRNNGDVLKPSDPRFKRFVAGRESTPIELAAGDVVIFSNWTLHETYITSSMREGRTSAEIRLLGNSETFLRRISRACSQ
jgi:hypothetical protein